MLSLKDLQLFYIINFWIIIFYIKTCLLQRIKTQASKQFFLMIQVKYVHFVSPDFDDNNPRQPLIGKWKLVRPNTSYVTQNNGYNYLPGDQKILVVNTIVIQRGSDCPGFRYFPC